MAKRFTDSMKYKKKFFRELPGSYKLLWDFLYHDCDNCGIWIVDFEIAQKYVGKDMPIDQATALKLFNTDEERIVEIDGGEKWFLPGYIDFQYVQLSDKNRAHIPVIAALKKFNLITSDFTLIKKNKEDTSPPQGAKDKAKEKDREKDKDKEMEKDKDGPEETSTNPDSLLEQMASVFVEHNPGYFFERLTDLAMLRSIAERILKWQKLEGSIILDKNRKIIKHRWGELVPKIRADGHLSKYSLTQLNKHFQSVVQSFNNGNNPKRTAGKDLDYDRP